MIPVPFVNYLPFLAAIAFTIPVSAQGLMNSDGAYLVVTDTAQIVINDGGFVNSGIFNAGNGIVAFTGTLPATLSGSSVTYFNTLHLNKPDNTLTLLQHGGANGLINLSAGYIDLNGYNLDLGTTGSLYGETADSRVVGPNGGFLVRSADITAGSSVNPGNLGLSFTPATNMGLTVIKRGHQASALTGNNSVHRFYEVASTNSGDAKQDITFQYFDEELNGNDESELGVYYVTTADTAGIWQTKKAANAANNTIQISNGTFNGTYLLASNITDSILAAPLVAKMDRYNAQLSWTTLYERNTLRFELQRSVKNSSFILVSTLPAAGFADTLRNYTYTDPASVADVWYYRYKIIFKDSTYRYSNIATVAPVGYPDIVLQVTPNPTTGPINIKFNSFNDQKVYLEVIGNTGALVTRQEINATTGMNTVTVDISNVGAGTYYVRLVNISDKAYKIIKLNP